jgi:SAM-dependent methyltransferase
MDPTTRAIRDQYEQFPYPAVAEPEIRLGADVRLLLSYGQLERDAGRPLHCLDAGCGRGNGVLGAATLQPDVAFTAIDVNRVALTAAAAKARELGLKNVRFQEVDLMTLEGLDVPPGGFDVVISSGVLHHLASPEAGLRHLRRVLAPHGILSLMVYGASGREPLYRMVRAIDLLAPRDRPLVERLAAARRLEREIAGEPLRVGPIELNESVPDNEFVDRYLNVNETSYDVASLFALLDRCDMRFLRWVEPADWELPWKKEASDLAAHLTPLERYRLVEQVSWRHQLALVAGTAANALRAHPPRDQWAELWFAMNPESAIVVELRTLRGAQRVERLTYKLRAREAQPVTGLTASVLLTLKDQTTAFQGAELIRGLAGSGIGAAQALDVLGELLDREIVYAPHASDR